MLHVSAMACPPRLAGRGAHEQVMVCSSHVVFRVEGITEASLTSDVFVACLFQHSCKGLAGNSEGVRKLRERTGLKEQGCVLASENVCPQVQFAAPCNFTWDGRAGLGHTPWGGLWQGERWSAKAE